MNSTFFWDCNVIFWPLTIVSNEHIVTIFWADE
jgi:hypothetical protein